MFLGRRKQVLQVGRAADSYWLLSGGEPPLRLVVDIRGGLEGGKRMRAFVRRLVGIAPPEPPLPLPPPALFHLPYQVPIEQGSLASRSYFHPHPPTRPNSRLCQRNFRNNNKKQLKHIQKGKAECTHRRNKTLQKIVHTAPALSIKYERTNREKKKERRCLSGEILSKPVKNKNQVGIVSNITHAYYVHGEKHGVLGS